jgi:hypothetical protein
MATVYATDEEWDAAYGSMEQEDVDAELLRQGIMSAKEWYSLNPESATTDGYLAYVQAQIAGHEEALEEPRLLPEPKAVRVDVVHGLKEALVRLRSLVDKENSKRLLSPTESSSNGEPRVNVLPPGEVIELSGEVPEKEDAVDELREMLTIARNERRWVLIDYTDMDGVKTTRPVLPLAVTEHYLKALCDLRLGQNKRRYAKLVGRSLPIPAEHGSGRHIPYPTKEVAMERAFEDARRTFFLSEIRHAETLYNRGVPPFRPKPGWAFIVPANDDTARRGVPHWVQNPEKFVGWEILHDCRETK